MQKKNLIYEGAVVVAVFAAMTFFLAEYAPYRMGFKEQISMFLLSADHLKWYFSHPACLAAIAGDWLTQFYWYGGAAIGITMSLLILLWLGTATLLKRSGSRFPAVAALLPSMVELYFLTWLNYPVSATLAMVLAVWTGAALAGQSRMTDLFLLVLGMPLFYAGAGFHALTLGMAVLLFRGREWTAWASFAAGILVSLAVGHQYNISFVQSLISPVPIGYITPKPMLTACSPLVFAITLITGKIIDRPWVSVPVAAILFGVVCRLGVDRSMELSLELGTNAYKDNWTRVYELSSKNRTGNMYATYYYNLCNARNDRLADGLFRKNQATSESLFLSVGQNSNYLSVFFYSDALLEMGDLSQATDCALLGQTIIPGGYTTRMFRRLAQTAMVAGDYVVAAKYLDMLAGTPVHGKWAREMKDCIERNEMPQDIMRWRSRSAKSDKLYIQGNWMSALSTLADQNPLNKTAVDYLLCGCLLDKKIGSFRSCYDRYYYNKLDRLVDVPELFQQALLTDVTSQEQFDATVARYSISNKTANDFKDFFGLNSASGRMNPEAHRDSYWYYIMSVQLNTEENQ